MDDKIPQVISIEDFTPFGDGEVVPAGATADLDDEFVKAAATTAGLPIEDEDSKSEKPEPATTEEAIEELKEERPAIKSKWGPSPIHNEQLTKLPNTVRVKARKIKVFCIADDDSAEEYNKFMESTFPEDAPSVIIEDELTEYIDNKWHKLIKYSILEYQQF